MNIKEFLNSNYVHVCDINNCPKISVYKGIGVGEIPTKLLKDIEWEYHYPMWGGVRTTCSNCDYREFDALMYARVYHSGEFITRYDVFITAILRRPFYKEQEEYYKKLYSLDLAKRPYHIYDSLYDKK